MCKRYQRINFIIFRAIIRCLHWIQIFISIKHRSFLFLIIISSSLLKETSPISNISYFQTFTFTLTLKQNSKRRVCTLTCTFNQGKEGVKVAHLTAVGAISRVSPGGAIKGKSIFRHVPIRGNPIHLYESVSLPTRLPVVEAWKFWPRVGGHSNSAFASRVFY